MKSENVIGAFSMEHAARLTGISIRQLERWDREGFFVPSYAADDRRSPYSRIYSFRDLVSLRVLNELRNEHRVSVQHLKRVAATLSHLGADKWIRTTLYVLQRKVVFDDPRTSQKQEIVSGQYVADIPLKVASANMRRAIGELNSRGNGRAGHTSQSRFVAHNETVFSGTRIPVSIVQDYLNAGYSAQRIIREYPDLTEDDIKLASEFDRPNIAA